MGLRKSCCRRGGRGWRGLAVSTCLTRVAHGECKERDLDRGIGGGPGSRQSKELNGVEWSRPAGKGEASDLVELKKALRSQ